MSLKAKLEAVIYAAEEPVTLAQLAALFADEALEWKADQDDAGNEASTSTSVAEPLPLLNDAFDYLEFELGSDTVSAPAGADAAQSASVAEENTPELAPAPDEAAGTQAGVPELEPDAEPMPAPVANEGSTNEASGEVAETCAAVPEINPEEAAKQAARQRDREVRAIIRKLLEELVADYATDGRGIEIREIAGGYRMATKPQYHDAVRSFVRSLKPAMKLSLPALETLAVIAYKQPVTAPEVNEIRGVDSSGVFGSLLARKLIATAGRKQVVGRPILYKTTKEFLLRFGLKDVTELPSMEEFEKMAASELEESEAAEAGGQAAEGSMQESSEQDIQMQETAEPDAQDSALEPIAISGARTDAS
jgi:segregation and condensation protein B